MRGLRKLALLCLGICVVASASSVETDPLSGKTIDGAAFSLGQERGHVVIVNFWATWCIPCRAEMPAMDRYYRRHRGEGLTMLAISVEAGASAGKLRRATAAYAFPVARLDDIRMPRAAIPAALPETRIYDRRGGLRYDSANGKPRSVMDEAILDRIVTPLLMPDATARSDFRGGTGLPPTPSLSARAGSR